MSSCIKIESQHAAVILTANAGIENSLRPQKKVLTRYILLFFANCGRKSAKTFGRLANRDSWHAISRVKFAKRPAGADRIAK